MKVLLTGSNGFIARSISKSFKENGFDVIGVGIEEKNKNPYVSTYCKWSLGHESIPNFLKKFKIDCIVHAASLIDGNDDNIELLYSNCIGTYQIYELSKALKVKSVIVLSSVPVIGLHCDKIIDDKTNYNPQTMYHATKASQELILNQLSKYKIRYCALRLPSPIGPGQPEKTIVPIFVRKAMENEDILLFGKGTRKQNYVDVRDIAECVVFLTKNELTQGVYLIGSNKTISNYELANICIDITGSESKIRYNKVQDPNDDDDWKINCERLAESGFKLKYSIRNTIADMVRYNEGL